MTFTLAAWTPGWFTPNAKLAPRAPRPPPGQLPKPRRAGVVAGRT